MFNYHVSYFRNLQSAYYASIKLIEHSPGTYSRCMPAMNHTDALPMPTAETFVKKTDNVADGGAGCDATGARFNAESTRSEVNPTLNDATFKFLATWFDLYNTVIPKDQHFEAFRSLTGSSKTGIEAWFSARLRSDSASNKDSGYSIEQDNFSVNSLNTSIDHLLDQNAISLCETWLRIWFFTMPNSHHFEAFSCLCNLPRMAIETWFAIQLRSGIALDPPENTSFKPAVWSSEPDHQSTVPWLNSLSNAYTSKIVTTTNINSNGTLPWKGQFAWDAMNENFIPLNPTPSGILTLMPSMGLDRDLKNDQNRALAHIATQALHRMRGCSPKPVSLWPERNSQKPFQCTNKCGSSFSKKDDLKKHEENKYPQTGFGCLVEPLTYAHGGICCGFCLQKEPPFDHFAIFHSGRSTVSAGNHDFCGAFSHRRAHFHQHFKSVHAHLNVAEYKQVGQIVLNAEFPKYCGFCIRTYESWTWEQRHRHFCQHFIEENRDMRDWKDLLNEAGSMLSTLPNNNMFDDDNDTENEDNDDNYDDDYNEHDENCQKGSKKYENVSFIQEADGRRAYKPSQQHNNITVEATKTRTKSHISDMLSSIDIKYAPKRAAPDNRIKRNNKFSNSVASKMQGNRTDRGSQHTTSMRLGIGSQFLENAYQRQQSFKSCQDSANELTVQVGPHLPVA